MLTPFLHMPYHMSYMCMCAAWPLDVRSRQEALPACTQTGANLHSPSLLQATDLHRTIREVCSVASEVEADADRLPKDWLFHVRHAVLCRAVLCYAVLCRANCPCAVSCSSAALQSNAVREGGEAKERECQSSGKACDQPHSVAQLQAVWRP